MKRDGHQQLRHATPEADLDRQHQGSIGGQHLAREGASSSNAGTVTSMRQSVTEDFTPGRDPAEGADVAFTAPVHERWAQHTAERDPTEGSALMATSPVKVK
ncbi:hypothetical protein KP001_04525 [Geomonas subterranea]|uniref:Uncharacterized protein n=1 Tax=Geomonas subterranea TaxID=2847989 RepID=A0ABX8LLP1_9BACT|nr:hypothetical protein [Geomonas subterranea]QXE91812.1 hypothetical protein KP001_04525 [Geomonas subterranea]QXM10095.1 hypothetical protein KP002_02970 [Geomonas subterranea]